MTKEHAQKPRDTSGVYWCRAHSPGIWHWLRQFGILSQRYWDIKKPDTGYWWTLAIQVPIIAALLILVFWARGSDNRALLFCVAISAHWFGLFSSVRELVSEYGLYQRERLLGLKITTFVLSRVPLLYAISFVQSAALLVLTYVFLIWDHHDGMGGNAWRALEMLWILALAAASGVSLGLALSALSLVLGRKTASRMGMVSSEVAMSLVPIALLPQVILGGPFYYYDNAFLVTRILSKLMPARWSLIALVGVDGTSLPETMAGWFGVQGDSVALSCTIIALMCLGLTILSVWMMKRLDQPSRI